MMNSVVEIEISKSIINETFRPLIDNESRFEIFYGGAGSGKSRFIAQRLVYRHLRDSGRKSLVVRKVGRTMRHSVYAEISNIISNWDVKNLFQINKSDLEITCVNGNKIIFSGLDDVDKLKSIQGITDIWVEEASETSRDDITQLNLRLRGISKVPHQLTMTFNPISALSWIKKDFFDVKRDNAVIHKSTYRDNKFLNQDYIDEIEKLKEQDPVYYQIYGLGEWGILGNLVYTNYEIREFNDLKFDTIYAGMDWGFNDPTAYIEVAVYDNVIYVLPSEFYACGLSNAELIEEFDSKKKQPITADSSEPARIKEWKKAGFRMKGARKGRGSIRTGIDWIRGRQMVIHPSNQNLINEIQSYSYRKDKGGELTEEPVDFNNHLMDALRYALENLITGRGLEFLK